MKFFADTASLDEIEYCFSRGVNDGITTNPKIMETTGDLSIGFEGACKRILRDYPNVPVSLETDLRGIPVSEIEARAEEVKQVLLRQADVLASWAPNVVVKIPICTGGINATKELAERGIKTNVTACMIPYQALRAARAGATYVSLFANRMLDSHILELAGYYNLADVLTENDWKNKLNVGKEKYFEKAWHRTIAQIDYVARKLDGTQTSLIVGSIRKPEDIIRISKARPQVITIPTGIVKGLEDIPSLKEDPVYSKEFQDGVSLVHPMTQYTLEEFERAADSYRK